MNSIAHNLDQKERTTDVLFDEDVSFRSFLLSDETLIGLQNSGFIKPSPIQLKAIPLGKCGFDLIVQSKSGTGKTGVFAVVALEMVDPARKDLQALIVAPTREIAVQIHDVIKTIGSEKKDLKVATFIGGLPLEEDYLAVKACHIAVGTPGRLKMLIHSGHLKINTVRLFVLDEADKLLESNMQTDINYMYHKLPKRKQTLALSATYSPELEGFLARYMQSATHVSPDTNTPLLLGLRQFVLPIKTNLNVMQQMNIKTEALVKVLSEISYTQCLVFSNYQVRVESICNKLKQKGWGATFISGAQTQTERLKAINMLKEFKCRILLSTDLTARGIDAANVDLVVNYDIPPDAATYLHRMGRAGRYGSKGLCINLANTPDAALLKNILGEIGGTSMSMQKLKYHEFPEDIWNDDLHELEVICGVIAKDSPQKKFDKILSSLLDLKSGMIKESGQGETKKGKKHKKESDEDKKEIDKEGISNILEDTNKKEADLSNKLKEKDAMSIFECLAAGSVDGLTVVESSDVKPLKSKENDTRSLLESLKCRMTEPIECDGEIDSDNESGGEIEHEGDTEHDGNIELDIKHDDVIEYDIDFDHDDDFEYEYIEDDNDECADCDEKSENGGYMDYDQASHLYNKKRKRIPEHAVVSSTSLGVWRAVTPLQESKKSTQSNNIQENRNHILQKNVALLALTKLLVEDSMEISEESKAATATLLNLVNYKREAAMNRISELTSNAQAVDILENMSEYVEASQRLQTQDPFKKFNILHMAFECALDRTKLNWLDYVDEPEEDPVEELNMDRLSLGEENPESEAVVKSKATRRGKNSRRLKRQRQSSASDSHNDGNNGQFDTSFHGEGYSGEYGTGHGNTNESNLYDYNTHGYDAQDFNADYIDHDYNDHEYNADNYNDHDYDDHEYNADDYNDHDYDDHDYEDHDYNDHDYNDHDYNAHDNNAYDSNAHDNNAYDSNVHDSNADDNNAHDNNAHDNNAHDKNAHDNNAHDNNAHDNNAHDNNAHDNNAQNYNAHDSNVRDNNAHGYNAHNYNARNYNTHAYNNTHDQNKHGQNKHQYNAHNYNTQGYNAQGYNPHGYNSHGHNNIAYNAHNYNTQGYNAHDNRHGYNNIAYNAHNYNTQGNNAHDYNRHGYNNIAYNAHNYNTQGYNAHDNNRHGFNNIAYNAHNYNTQGYIAHDINRHGYNNIAYNAHNYNTQGYNAHNYIRHGYNVPAYNVHHNNAHDYNVNHYNAQNSKPHVENYYSREIFDYNAPNYKADRYYSDYLAKFTPQGTSKEKTDKNSKEQKIECVNDKAEGPSGATAGWCQTYGGSEVPTEQHDKNFSQYFQHYDECLSKYVDTFSDVAKFQQWFGEWENNLHQVRDYVQQRIYVQEMTKQY